MESQFGSMQSPLDGATVATYAEPGGVPLTLYIVAPPAARGNGHPLPAIVFFFGGGWQAGRLAQFAYQARHLAARGMTAALADYRVASRHGTTPFEAMADARAALRWLRRQASSLSIDPDRVAAAGGSAGGHLALCTALIDGPADEASSVRATPDALVLFNPVTETAGEHGVLRRCFGDRGREASPFHHLGNRLPPTLILHGEADTTVPFASVQRFTDAARVNGLDCTLIGYPGCGHGFFNAGEHGSNPMYEATLAATDQFLTRIGFLQPKV